VTQGNSAPLHLHRARPKLLCTEALHRFYVRHNEIFDFFFFGTMLASRADQMSYTAAEALATGGSQEDIDRFEELKKNKDRTLGALARFGHIQSENMCTRLVDNFLTYVSQLLQAVLLKKPEMLRSSEMVRLDEILRFKRFRDLIAFLADRKINELGYGGLQGIEDFVRDRTGLQLVSDQDKRSSLTIAIELRNIYTHNRGIANDLFLKRLSKVDHKFSFKLGERYHANFDTIAAFANNIFDIAQQFDSQIAQKFGLKRTKFRTQKSQ
jgi:hypothetical protein